MPTIEQLKKRNMGYVTSLQMLEEVVTSNRLQLMLVRCGGGRFLAPAQDVKHFVDMVNKSSDYVRDISFK